MEAASNSELILTTPVIVFFAAPAIAVPLALLVSLGLLRIYRRAVMRSMQWRGTPAAAVGMMAVLENSPARSGESSRHSLEITPHDPPADGTRLAVRRTMWPSAAVQVCAGLSYAMFIASWWLVAVDRGFDWLVFLTMSVWFGWPMVITVGLAVTVSWRGFALLVVGYAKASFLRCTMTYASIIL